MQHVDFYFDFASPWAYLASTRIERLCADFGKTVRWHAIDLYELDQLTGRERPPTCAAMFAYTAQDLARWAQRYGVQVNLPTMVPTTPALRGCYFARDVGCEAHYIHRVFQARWRDADDLSDETVIRSIAADCGLEGDALLRAFAGDETAQRLMAATREAADRGVFGVPTTIVGDELFWGNDRLDFVRDTLARAKK